jgi:hypothetical protein
MAPDDPAIWPTGLPELQSMAAEASPQLVQGIRHSLDNNPTDKKIVKIP